MRTAKFLFQKQSSLLNDINYLIDMRFQMGFSFERELSYHLPNATKCLTWQDVKQTHATKDQRVVVKLDDIYGMLILLALGLNSAVMFVTVELVYKALKKSFRTNSQGLGMSL